MFIYKILKKSPPAYLHNMFEYAINAVTGRPSRNLYRLFVPQVMEGVVYTTVKITEKTLIQKYYVKLC